jgi:hypothetical protein
MDAPLTVEGAQHFVERNYRESGRYQWVRETLVNAIEAGATRVEFGTEWQGVSVAGVYRRTIADNGRGMTPDELVAFFRTYGGSGKPIGGLHENFGIGAKSSLFPWNSMGVVIVSWHADYEEPSLIWVRKNPHTGEYGLRTWDTSEGGELVIVANDDDDLGIDWSLVKPDFIDDHGTVVVLLGDDLEQDTVLGDESKDEAQGVPGVAIVDYLNRRMWDLGDVEVYVDEYRETAKTGWPKTSSTTLHGKLQRGTRRVQGAKWYIEYEQAADKGGGSISNRNTMKLGDGTEIDWYLWSGDGRDGIRGAAKNGYIAAEYSTAQKVPELFDVTDHAARFRSFGISEADVRRRLWLVVRPRLAADHSYGVYMSSDRNRLLVQGGPRAGDPLPWDEWAVEFADHLPQEIIDAINEARAGDADTDLDESWRERLAERFSKRWRQIRLFADPSGTKTTDPDEAGQGGVKSTKRRPKRKAKKGRNGNGGQPGGNTGTDIAGKGPGSESASEREISGGLPAAHWESDEDLFDPGMFAVWNPPSAANPTGLVQLNVNHPVFQEERQHWVSQYPPHLEDDVIKTIKDVYAEMAVATVAHSESLKRYLERKDDIDKLRSPEALTTGLLGLVGASAMLGPRLGGALGRRRQPPEGGKSE